MCPGVSKRAGRAGAADVDRDVEKPAACAYRRPQGARYDGSDYHVWHKTDLAGGPAGQVSGGRRAGRRCGSSIPASTASHNVTPGRRHDGREVRRAQGHADVLHHQGHPQPAAAVGPRAARRDDRAGAGDVGRAVAGVRGRRLPAAVVVLADLHRRHGPLAGRPYVRKKPCAGRPHRGAIDAEGDKSPGVLLASGYIAGGAIAGIVIAFMAGITADFTQRITSWSTPQKLLPGGAARPPTAVSPPGPDGVGAFPGREARLWARVPHILPTPRPQPP